MQRYVYGYVSVKPFVKKLLNFRHTGPEIIYRLAPKTIENEGDIASRFVDLSPNCFSDRVSVFSAGLCKIYPIITEFLWQLK